MSTDQGSVDAATIEKTKQQIRALVMGESAHRQQRHQQIRLSIALIKDGNHVSPRLINSESLMFLLQLKIHHMTNLIPIT